MSSRVANSAVFSGVVLEWLCFPVKIVSNVIATVFIFVQS